MPVLPPPPTITLCHGKSEVLPDESRLKIVAENHESLLTGHKGVTKTYRRIQERYTWPGLRNDVKKCIRESQSCLENKLIRAHTREPMVITDTTLGLFGTVSLDTAYMDIWSAALHSYESRRKLYNL